MEFARRFPTALVQLQVELPFGNRTAQANVARAEIAAEQIARQRQRLEQVIEVEVRNALQAVQSARSGSTPRRPRSGTRLSSTKASGADSSRG